ncbi:MAG: DinB family protein [Candidatus Cloacimonetes bacterium]|jgi:uncharacterized damage-inducible protein DinB|nr:DinB family protein [Candidatus Cloacimonadota bacterium]
MQAVRSVRPARGEYDEYYDKYVRRVPDGDITETLVRQVVATIDPLRALDDARANHAYAPGKWTVKEVIGHLCDAERVFTHRALRFGRGDATPLPGFDENAYVPAGQFGERTLNDLLDELLSVRAATVALFRHLPPAAWTRTGTANGVEVSVRALAWISAGHELHHRALLEERYGIPMQLGSMAGPV